jgi:predicted transcriptional regulator
MTTDATAERRTGLADPLLDKTTEIISAFLSRNSVDSSQIAELIRQVHGTLKSLTDAPHEEEVGKQKPAVAPKKSVFHDYIICLEDGKKLKMLKRYLQTRFNMTPDDYRAKWGLSSDYPMVAPGYAERRSAVAREIGLGRRTPVTGRGRKKNAI